MVTIIAQWLEWWTGNPVVAGLSPAPCYISAIDEEGTG